MFRTAVKTNPHLFGDGGKFIVERNVTDGEVIVAGRACGFFGHVGQFWLSGNRRFLVFR